MVIKSVNSVGGGTTLDAPLVLLSHLKLSTLPSYLRFVGQKSDVDLSQGLHGFGGSGFGQKSKQGIWNCCSHSHNNGNNSYHVDTNVMEENLSACKIRLFGRFKDQNTQRVPVRPAEREQKGSTHCR